MFRGINLCGAEVNTKFSEQHRTHLLHSYIGFIIISFPLVVKPAKLSKIAWDMNAPSFFHAISGACTKRLSGILSYQEPVENIHIS